MALGAGAVRRGPVRVPALRPVRLRARGARLLHPARVPALRSASSSWRWTSPSGPPSPRAARARRGWWSFHAPFLAYAVVAQLQAFWLYKRFRSPSRRAHPGHGPAPVQRRHRARGRRPRRGHRHEALPGDPRPAGDCPCATERRAAALPDRRGPRRRSARGARPRLAAAAGHRLPLRPLDSEVESLWASALWLFRGDWSGGLSGPRGPALGLRLKGGLAPAGLRVCRVVGRGQ